MSDGNYLERAKAFADAWQSAMDDDLTSDVIAVIDGKPLREPDLRALVAEVEQLRAQSRADAAPECPVCGRTDITLTKAGRMRYHWGDIWSGGRRQVCTGSGEAPTTGGAQ